MAKMTSLKRHFLNITGFSEISVADVTLKPDKVLKVSCRYSYSDTDILPHLRHPFSSILAGFGLAAVSGIVSAADEAIRISFDF